MGLWNLHYCIEDCGEVFKTWYCERCRAFIKDRCKKCHNNHVQEIKRLSDLARLKRSDML